MSHKAVSGLIKDTVESLQDNIQFFYGRASDFNQVDKNIISVALDPLTASATFSNNNVQDYSKTWAVQMAFWKIDTEDSIETQYQLILDETDSLVDRFINKLNNYAIESELSYDLNGELLVISGISQQPFIKATASVLTGWTVTFNIQVPDTFDYCANDC